MNMNIKSISLATLIVLLTACSVCKTDANKVSSAASEIMDFDLPAGYTPELTASLMGYTVASFRLEDGHSHVYMRQSEKDPDDEKLEQMLEELVPGASDPHTRLTVIETRPVTVCRQETTLVISERDNSDGESYRQATLAFPGKSGPAQLVPSLSLSKAGIRNQWTLS